MPDFFAKAVELLRDSRIAAPVICVLVLATGFLYTGLLFERGPEVIRPASAQNVRAAVTSAKSDVLAQIGTVKGQLTTIGSAQTTIEDSQLVLPLPDSGPGPRSLWHRLRT